jgi:hypothetical protein
MRARACQSMTDLRADRGTADALNTDDAVFSEYAGNTCTDAEQTTYNDCAAAAMTAGGSDRCKITKDTFACIPNCACSNEDFRNNAGGWVTSVTATMSSAQFNCANSLQCGAGEWTGESLPSWILGARGVHHHADSMRIPRALCLLFILVFLFSSAIP